MYKAKIEIRLRPSILDPQGKATQSALHNLGFDGVDEVRIGKLVEMHINAESEANALIVAKQACEKLVANTVMENYSILLEAVAAV